MQSLRVVGEYREDKNGDGFLSAVDAVTSDVGRRRGLEKNPLASERAREVAAQIAHGVGQALLAKRCVRPSLSPPVGCVAGVVSMALHDVLFRSLQMNLAPHAQASSEAAGLCGTYAEQFLQGISARAS